MDDDPKRLSTRIQMLATLVATATYAAGFNLPGGVWQDIHDTAGHLPGDPIMRSTTHFRYPVFFYCNAIAFILSLIVVVITLFVNTAHLKDKERKQEIHMYLGILMAPVMVAFTVAYGAGACRTKLTIFWYGIQVPFPFLFVMYQAFARWKERREKKKMETELKEQDFFRAPAPLGAGAPAATSGMGAAAGAPAPTHVCSKPYFQALHSFSVMVPLSMFALTITYVAGLSTPGGFWGSAEGGHRPGHAILGDRLQGRILKGFLTSNTSAFLASLYALSLLIVVKLKKPQETSEGWLRELFPHPLFRLSALSFYLLFGLLGAYIVGSLLLGLLGAYIVGSSRGSLNWPLYGEIFACMVVCVVVHVLVMETAAYCEEHYIVCSRPAGKVWSAAGKLAGEVSRGLMQMCRCAARSEDQNRRQPDPAGPGNNEVATEQQKNNETGQQRRNDAAPTDEEKEKNEKEKKEKEKKEKEKKKKDARRRRQASLVQLMAGLAVAITYQAGLYPPGGLWAANADDGQTAGDPILLTTHARRYKGFYYCNSVSFVASLLAMFLAQQAEKFNKHHALEAAMLLDMLGLAGAYAIGTSRDQVSTLYVAGLACAGVVYVFVHVSYFTLGDKGDTGDAPGDGEDAVENMGGRFLLFAVLVASMTYQAGLTPPGGFLLQDDAQSGHHAGDPVLLYNYPRRYRAFFYCNSVSFMTSIVLILLLVNPNEYRPAIRSHALSVCSAVSYVCLIGAFAAGSTQHRKESYVIFALAGLPSLPSAIILIINCRRWKQGEKDIENKGLGEGEQEDARTTYEKRREEEEEKRRNRSVYLVTLGILVASATYSAGLDPPGGSWGSSSDGHDAGNPVMHDSRRQRYLAFFVGNTVSFLSSLMLILVLLLSMMLQRRNCKCTLSENVPHELQRCRICWRKKWVNGVLVSLQCLGFLEAYAAGSSRKWKTSAHIATLVSAVLLFVAIHVGLSYWRRPKKPAQEKQPGQG